MQQKTIAVIGASSERRKFGNKCVRAYMSAGYTVYPIHPMENEIEGLKVCRSVLDLPSGKLDRVSVYLNPAVGLTILPELAKREIAEIWLNPGAESAEIVKLGQELGLKIVCGCSIVDVGVSPADLPNE